MLYNFVADSIHKINFVADFFQVKCNLDGKRPFCIFNLRWGTLRATYAVHLRLIGNRVVDFLLVIIEHFSLGVMAEVIRANID